MRGATRLRVLGPVRLETGADDVAPSGAKQRLLLAMLASRAGRHVSADSLVEALWPDHRPADPRHALENHISRLRRMLDTDVEGIRRVGDGYELVTEAIDIDACRFEELIAHGRRATGAGRLEEGLRMLRSAARLWRGPPFDDVADGAALAAERGRLEGLRRRANDARFDAELVLGHHDAVIDELMELVAEDPLDERRRGQLMLALYRSGRQAEALGVYDDAVLQLRETLGVDPGPGLNEVRLLILRQDDPRAAVDRRTGEDRGRPFVGRKRELEGWRQLSGRLMTGRGGMLIFSGAPGIGKSRLLEVIAESGAEMGFDVVWGRCREEAEAPPYWPWAQVLRSLRDDGVPVEGLAALILDEARPAPEDPARESDRFRLFSDVGRALVAASRRRPVVVILDDLHAADRSSLQLLDVSADLTVEAPVAFVAAYRPAEGERRGTARIISGVSRTGTIVPIDGLTRDETAELLRRLGPGLETEVVEWISDAGDGNPLFICELARWSDRRRGNGRPSTLPPVLDTVIRQRLDGLPPDVRTCLEVMAVVGRQAHRTALEAVADVDETALHAALEAAISADILEHVGSDAYRFVHVLFRDALETDLSPSRRLDVHAAVAAWLESLPAEQLGRRLPELAHHHLALVPRHGAHPAVTWLRRAGDAAAGEFAWEQAADLYDRATGITTDPVDRAELLLRRAEMQRRSGDRSAVAAFQQAFEAAESGGRPDLMARAAMGCEDARWRGGGNDDAGPVIELLQRALARVPATDASRRVQLLARLSRAAHYWDVELAADAGLEAGALVDDLRDPVDVAIALEGHRWGLWTGRTGPTFASRRRLAERMLDHAHRSGDDELVLRALLWKLHDVLEAGDVPVVDRSLSHLAGIAGSVHQPRYIDWVRVCEAMRLLRLGRYDDARALRASLAERAERGGDSNIQDVLLGQAIIESVDRGDVRESGIHETLRDVITGSPALGRALLPMLALLEAEAGNEAAAAAVFADLVPDRFAAVPSTLLWSTGMSMLALATPWVRQPDAAATLVDLLRPWAGTTPLSGPEVYFWGVDLGLGVAALVAGQHQQAQRHLTDACRHHERINAPAWLARSQLYLARAIIEGTRGELPAACRLLEACIATSDRLGLRAVGARARSLLGGI